MQNHRNATKAPAEGLMRTRHTLVCGASARRPFALLRDLGQEQPMSAVALASKQLPTPAALEQEILARVDRAGLHVCETELRHTLRWDEQNGGSLLDLLDELERRGLIESALHFRLTQRGRTRLPDNYQPPLRYGSPIPWRHRSSRRDG